MRMYIKPPHSRNIAADNEQQLKTTKEDDRINADFDIRKIREHDLLLLTDTKLDLKGGSDIKKVMNADFIKKLLSRSNSLMALVT